MKMFTHHGLFPRFSRLLAAACVGIFFSTAAQAQEVITIEQAVERMLQNNINIKQSALDVANADVNLSQSRAALFPSLGIGITENFRFGRTQDETTFQIYNTTNAVTVGNVNANVNVFGGLTRINQIRQNKILLEANKSALERTKNDLVLQVVTSYFNVVFNEDLLTASIQQLFVAQQTLERENALMDAGNKTMADISQAKAQVATAELNVTNAQNQLTISFLTLSQLMEMRADNTNYKVVPPTIEDIKYAQKSYNVNEVFTEALNLYPNIKLAQLNREAAEVGVKVAKGSLFPSLSLNAGLGTSYSYLYNFPNETFANQIESRFNQGVGLSLQIPIFNGFAAKSNVKRAKIQYQGFINQEQLERNNLNKIIAQAIADLRAADARYSSTEKTFNAQEDAFMVIEERYNVGLVNSLDYNTARTNRNNAEIDFIQAKYDLLFRSKVIDFYLGKEITF